MSDVDKLIARLDSAIRTAHPRFYESLGPASSAEEIDALETLAGLPLPGALRALLAWHCGSWDEDVETSIASWRLMHADEAAEAVTMMRELLAEDDSWEETTWWSRNWIPFLDDDGGQYVCVDLDGIGNLTRCDAGAEEFTYSHTPLVGVPGQVVMFDHEIGPCDVLAPSLKIWLASLADAIGAGALEAQTEVLPHCTIYSFDGPGVESFTRLASALAPGYPISIRPGGAAK